MLDLMKNTLLLPAICFGILGISTSAHAVNRTFLPVTPSDYLVGGNWSGSAIPRSGDVGIIASGRTANLFGDSGLTSVVIVGNSNTTASDGTLNYTGGAYTIGQVLLGRNGGSASEGSTGTLEMSGGNLRATGFFRVGNDQATLKLSEGVFNLSGGNLSVSGLDGMKVGEESRGTMTQTAGTVLETGGGVQIGLAAGATGSSVSVSGGSFDTTRFINVGNASNPTNRTLNVSGSGSVTWGSNATSGSILSVYGNMNVTGSGATLSSINTNAGAFNVRSSGTLQFNLAADGNVSLIDIAGAEVGFQSGGSLVIDGSLLTLGAGSYDFTLIDHAGYASTGGFNASTLATSFTNFGPDYTPSVSFNAGDVTLSIVAVPEPSTYALIGAGLLLVCVLRRRRQLA